MAMRQEFEVPTGNVRSLDYERVSGALNQLVDAWPEQPSLSALAASCGLSESHLQRTFARWVGLSPKKFMQFLTLQRAKNSLDAQASVLDTSLGCGLSGPGRLHDLFVSAESVTPGEYKNRGRGLALSYGWHESPFGDCLIAQTDRGICGLAFAERGEREAARTSLLAGWENATTRFAPELTAPWAQRIFASSGAVPNEAPLRLLLRGTPFQVKVWEALLRIPEGETLSYGMLASRMGYASKASRAVGSAVGANAIAYLIPCHRVIRGSGALGGYRWGLERKVAMLGWERATRAMAG